MKVSKQWQNSNFGINYYFKNTHFHISFSLKNVFKSLTPEKKQQKNTSVKSKFHQQKAFSLEILFSDIIHNFICLYSPETAIKLLPARRMSSWRLHIPRRDRFLMGERAVSPACLSIINLCADSFIAMSQFFKGARKNKLKALRDPAVFGGRMLCVSMCSLAKWTEDRQMSSTTKRPERKENYPLVGGCG